MRHDGSELFDGVPEVFGAVQFNSLTVDSKLPDELEATAWATSQGYENVMGLRHRTKPLSGVQFHPEVSENSAVVEVSVLTILSVNRFDVWCTTPFQLPHSRSLPPPYLQPITDLHPFSPGSHSIALDIAPAKSLHERHPSIAIRLEIRATEYRSRNRRREIHAGCLRKLCQGRKRIGRNLVGFGEGESEAS